MDATRDPSALSLYQKVCSGKLHSRAISLKAVERFDTILAALGALAHLLHYISFIIFTLYFLSEPVKIGWGSAVLSFLTFEHFSRVLNFLWKWASKFLVLNFLLDLANNAKVSPQIGRNMAQNKPFFLQFWGFEPKDLTLRTNAKY